jgi:hypothetical protein
MPAKPQPMAGQSDAADDLIAELAKLMAQDAHGDRPAAPTAPATSPVPIRIPGEAAQSAPDKPRLDFVRSSPEQNADQPVANPQPAAASAEALPVTASAKPADDLADPFRFDFDFGASKRGPAEPVAAPAVARAEPAPVAAPTQAPAAAAAATPVPDTAPQPIDHDSIAELIAAEFAVDFQSTPPAAPTAPEPAAVPPAEPASVPPAEPRQAPNAGSGWAPTTVAPSLGGQQRPARPPLRAVNLQPAPKSEHDRFKVAPVFGLATTPAQSAETIVPTVERPTDEPAFSPSISAEALSQPKPVEAPVALRQTTPSPVVAAAPAPRPADAAGLDPIDEIESLIGRAMRVEFDKPASAPAPVEERPAPSPALRSLATPTVAAPDPRALSAADEAVFAAAQATGAQVGWVEAPEVFESEPASGERAERRGPRALGMTRAVAGPLVAVTLLLAAGFGLYWVLGLGGRDSGPAPLLTADTTPVKEVVPAAAPDAAAAQQSVVFNEIDGVVPGAEEQLVSRDQADVNEVTQVATATPELSEEGLANRKVRTVTVRPDGTIVSGDDSVAGSAILPVDRPNVPAVPGAETASPELLASADADAVTPAAAPAAAEEPAVAAVPPVEPGSTVPVVDLTGNPVAGKTAVVPLMRPAGLASVAPTAAVETEPTSVNAIIDAATATTPVSAEVQQPAAPEPVAAAAVEQPAAAPVEQPAAIPGATEVEAVSNDAPAYVQLASQRSEAEARQTAQTMVTRFGPLFGGANMEVQRVDLGAKGIYYRVRVPANSMEQANSICTNVKAAGGDCFTM